MIPPIIAGVALVAISALFFSSAGIFAKLIPETAWDILFWRGLAAASLILAYLGVTGRLRPQLRGMTWPGMAVAVMYGLGSIAFIQAFKLTSVTHVVLIYAAAPFLAALLGWLTLGEVPGRRTLIASGVSLAGVCIILWGSGQSLSGGGLTGDLLALFMTLMLAGAMVTYRRWPDTPAGLPAALSSVFVMPFAAAIGAPFDVPTSSMGLILIFGCVFALASVLLAEGARRLPPADTALISTLETPLAPILAWFILAEHPDAHAVTGGAMILGAVIWSQSRSRATA